MTWPETFQRALVADVSSRKMGLGFSTCWQEEEHLSLQPSVTTGDTWSWEQYLRDWSAVAAPIELFSKDQSSPEQENGFQVGMRIEGIDPWHPAVFCGLSVADVCGYRLSLHFDDYLSSHDFWTNAGSPGIHPVGWCKRTNHELHIPKGYRKGKIVWMDYLKAYRLQNAPKKLFRSRSAMKMDFTQFQQLVRAPYGKTEPQRALGHWFSWTEYLEANQANAVPARVFNTRAPHGFLPNMKLEVVDKQNPQLIPVATIVDVDDHTVKIHFDGWRHKYGYWMDADSPDIHPIGWCDVTGHPLEVPHGASDVNILPGQAVCPTPGCRGIGHSHSAFGCPYSDMNLRREAALQVRPREQTQTYLESYSSHSTLENLHNLNFNGKCEEMSSQSRLVQQAKCLKIVKGKEDIGLDNLYREYPAEQAQQVLQPWISVAAMSTHPFRDLPLGWEQHCKMLPGVASTQASQVAGWTVDQVAEFVQSLLGCEEHAKCFKNEQIDGKAFLLLTQADIVKVMKIKLGPALKIYNSILMFRNSQDITEDDVAMGQEPRR
ncbi:lethal(3)malignant brain tumor-like protein 4 [Phodopus roborovskii]|uniref:lethal(3)malignant brain tumor-like protein 4 n=1 Tax=Phodopus roborovskii TaxID=109678 RepID=UPI0021E464E8|nr:lethal(3)malignant brain tumor-like protein 4 [Phodopus roborovskii]